MQGTERQLAHRQHTAQRAQQLADLLLDPLAAGSTCSGTHLFDGAMRLADWLAICDADHLRAGSVAVEAGEGVAEGVHGRGQADTL